MEVVSGFKERILSAPNLSAEKSRVVGPEEEIVPVHFLVPQREASCFISPEGTAGSSSSVSEGLLAIARLSNRAKTSLFHMEVHVSRNRP